MKKLIYSAVLAAIIALPAQAINSELSISMANQQKFTLTFDNSFYSTPSTTYNVTNVLPGNHHVRMTSVPSQMIGACGFPQMLFDGWVNIPQNTRLTAFPANISQLNIVSMVPLISQYYNPYDPYGNNNGNTNYPYGEGNNYGDPYGNPYGNPSGYPNNNYGYGNNYPQYYGMSQDNFSALKNSIDAQSFDSGKLTIAKQAVGSNQMTSMQVKELVSMMTFESNKLDLAKFAYSRTIDKNNYYQVSDAFTFSSSVTDLSTYINNYHG
ncbi:hypothetical protein BH09BAC5_BH09BAC5_25740 [soil metagenome]